MSILIDYWWAILGIGGLLIYTWRAARRASRDLIATSAPADGSGPSGPDHIATRDRDSRSSALPLILLVVVTFLLRDVSHAFNLVREETRDYILPVLIGSALAVAFARRQVHPDFGPDPRVQQPIPRATFLRAVLGLVVGTLLAGALLRIANGFLDRGSLRNFAAVVTARHCTARYSHSLTLRGAPLLPVDDNTVELQGCGKTRVGDTVFLVVRPGFLGRPWIASYRAQTAEDRFRQLLEQRRRNAR